MFSRFAVPERDDQLSQRPLLPSSVGWLEIASIEGGDEATHVAEHVDRILVKHATRRI